MKLFRFADFVNESLPQAKSIEQLEKVRKLSKSTDIGDKTKEEGANLLQQTNPIDTGVETYQDYMFNNKDFDMKNPLNNQKKTPREYVAPQTKHKYPKETFTGKANKKVKP